MRILKCVFFRSLIHYSLFATVHILHPVPLYPPLLLLLLLNIHFPLHFSIKKSNPLISHDDDDEEEEDEDDHNHHQDRIRVLHRQASLPIVFSTLEKLISASSFSSFSASSLTRSLSVSFHTQKTGLKVVLFRHFHLGPHLN